MSDSQSDLSSKLVSAGQRLIADITRQLDSDAWVIINNFSVSSVEKVYDAAALRHCASLLEDIIAAFESTEEMTIRILGRAHIEAFLFGSYIHFGGVEAIRTVRLSEDTSQTTMRTELEAWDEWLERSIKKNVQRGKKVRESRTQIELRRKGGLTAKEREHLTEPHVPRANFRREAVANLTQGISNDDSVEFGVSHAVAWLSENGPKLGFATERFDPLYHLYRAYSAIGPHPNISVYESYVVRNERKTFIRTAAKPLRSIAWHVLLDSVVSTAQLAEWILEPCMNGETFANEVLRSFKASEDNFQGWRPQ